MNMNENDTVFALKVKLALHWGLASRIVPFSKTRRTLKAPPPTTLIGALFYPFSYYRKIPENLNMNLSSATLFTDFIVSVHASLNFSASIYSDINRVYWYHKARRKTKTDAIALEKIYASPLNETRYPCLNVIYIIEPKAAERSLGSYWKEILEAISWSIVRVGPKESVVSTVDVDSAFLEVKYDGDIISTSYYIPMEIVEEIMEGEFTIQDFVPPRNPIGDYSSSRKIPYLIPYSFFENRPAKVKLKLKEKAAVLVFNKDIVAFNLNWIKGEKIERSNHT